MNFINILIVVLALILGVVAGYFLRRYQAERALKNQQDKADNILKVANEQARLIESQSRDYQIIFFFSINNMEGYAIYFQNTFITYLAPAFCIKWCFI